jgi:DNA invertase Pin-like site-specific DNA recombinase
MEGCERQHYAKGMCVYHYQRDWAGRPLEGRAYRTGEAHPNSKLTAEKVRAIRRLHAQGWTTTALGREYGIHHSAVRKIIRWQTWRNVV